VRFGQVGRAMARDKMEAWKKMASLEQVRRIVCETSLTFWFVRAGRVTAFPPGWQVETFYRLEAGGAL
jgi:hypothetical protein